MQIIDPIAEEDNDAAEKMGKQEDVEANNSRTNLVETVESVNEDDARLSIKEQQRDDSDIPPKIPERSIHVRQYQWGLVYCLANDRESFIAPIAADFPLCSHHGNDMITTEKCVVCD